LTISPASRQIQPGGVTTYQVNVTGSITEAVSLSATDSSAQALTGLSPASVTPPGQATLTVTSTHTALSLNPAETVNLTVTATGNGITKTAKATLLVGGSSTYLPIILVKK
jgi:hypothetical protein